MGSELRETIERLRELLAKAPARNIPRAYSSPEEMKRMREDDWLIQALNDTAINALPQLLESADRCALVEERNVMYKVQLEEARSQIAILKNNVRMLVEPDGTVRPLMPVVTLPQRWTHNTSAVNRNPWEHAPLGFWMRSNDVIIAITAAGITVQPASPDAGPVTR